MQHLCRIVDFKQWVRLTVYNTHKDFECLIVLGAQQDLCFDLAYAVCDPSDCCVPLAGVSIVPVHYQEHLHSSLTGHVYA